MSKIIRIFFRALARFYEIELRGKLGIFLFVALLAFWLVWANRYKSTQFKNAYFNRLTGKIVVVGVARR